LILRGLNYVGQLGRCAVSSDFFSRVFRPIHRPLEIGASSLKFINIFACGNRTYVLTSTGECYGCGQNNTGQLGIQTKSIHLNTLHRIPKPSYNRSSYWKDIQGGSFMTAFLDESGNVYTCGENISGELGHGPISLENISKPRQIEGLNNILGISVGDTHMMAWNASGECFCWGFNAQGQCSFE